MQWTETQTECMARVRDDVVTDLCSGARQCGRVAVLRDSIVINYR